jgi:hypothetical protein
LDHQGQDDAFLQQFVLSEEDRQRRHPTTQWTGGYRWFRSLNVVKLELYRTQAEMDRIRGVILNPERGLPRVVTTPPEAKVNS